MKKQRKLYTPEEKVAILRKHLVEGVLISDPRDEPGLRPTVSYRWQKVFFENGTAAFQQMGRRNHHARRASAGDSGRARSEVGSGEGTAEEWPPAGRVTDETDYFRLADNSGLSPGP